MSTFADMKLNELKAKASEMDIPGRSKLTKLGLIQALERAYAKTHRTSNLVREINYSNQRKRCSPKQRRRLHHNRYTHV